MRVAVIGAGASGLTAIKCCLDEGLEPVCYERSHDIGGLWRYTDEVTEGQSCVMKSTVINTSKEMMSYSDFPIPADYPMFMHNTFVQKYFTLYSDKFNLRKYIHFGKEIPQISKHTDFAKTGQWNIMVKDKKSGEVKDLVYDAVMVCTGHHADKHVPDFPGLSDFKGRVLHSHDYRNPTGFEDKRVLIIGIGNSGGDMAVELSRIASKVNISTRRGSWVLNRISNNGMPLDMIRSTRLFLVLRDLLPVSVLEGLAQNELNKRFDHAIYSLKPKHGVFSQHPMVNDEMPNRLSSGTLQVRPDVKQFTENGVIFDDGTKEENIDVVVLATGYKFGFPFLDKSVVEVVQNRVELYKYVFPPQLEKNTLCIVGCFQPIGAIMPMSEMQCRWATRVFQVHDCAHLPSQVFAIYDVGNVVDRKHLWGTSCGSQTLDLPEDGLGLTLKSGKVQLPNHEEMMSDIRAKAAAMKVRYVQTQRHTIQVDYIDYMDELSKLNGVLPDLKSLLWSDPKLAMACFFGPCTPYQYRLNGPGKWDGARQAILTQWDRTLNSLKTRPLGFSEKSQKKFFLFFIIFVAVFCILFQGLLMR